MRLLVILNPQAGGGGASESLAQGLEALRRAGHVLEVRETGHPGEAAELAHVHSEGVERIVVCGGDGTISRVATGLVASRRPVPLALVPTGTGNDFARSVGTPLDPAAALRLAGEGLAVPVDVGLAGARPFLNASSGGVPAEISRRTPKAMKAALGPLAYLAVGVARIASLRPFYLEVEGEGMRHAGPVLFFAVANGRWVGGGSCVAPEARVDDGLLDLVVLPALDSGRFAAARALRAGRDHPGLLRARGTRFLVQTDRPIALTTDGEGGEVQRVEFAVLPGALQIVAHPVSAPAVEASPSAP